MNVLEGKRRANSEILKHSSGITFVDSQVAHLLLYLWKFWT